MSAGLPYLRSRGRRWTALLLPALLLRALIPFGFMPMVAGGGMTIGFCPGEAELPPGIAIAHHGDAHPGHSAAAHGGGHAGDLGGGAHHAPCLFAASASPAVSPVIVALAPHDGAEARATAPAATHFFLPTILRAQSPRGPPLPA
jgi:hypothetical protein